MTYRTQFSFCHEDPGAQTQLVSLGGRTPYPLRHLLQALNSSLRVDSVGGEKYMGVIDSWRRVTQKTYKIPKT